LSLRTRGTAPGFNTITADPSEIEVIAWGWTGSVFAQDRAWKLGRRTAA
jgi:hypothetical protein